MAERRLSGWRRGSKRNEDKLQREDLIPYDDLSQVQKSYDINLVKATAELVSGK